jgi:heat shock protein HtpX
MNMMKTMALMTVMTLLFLLAGNALGGQQGMIFAFVIAVGMNFFSYWFSDKVVLKMYRATEATEADAPELYGVVRELTTRARMPMPKVYIIPGASPNAFATGRNPEHAAVAATQGILRMLNRDELAAVMAHELAHVGNRDILTGAVVATFAGAITMMAHMAQWAMIFGGGRDNDEGGNPIALIAMMILAPLAATIIQLAISRSREFAADATGSRLCGQPLALASALAKLEAGSARAPMQARQATAHMFIVNPLRGKGMANLFRTHPKTEDRVARLREQAQQMGQTVR